MYVTWWYKLSYKNKHKVVARLNILIWFLGIWLINLLKLFRLTMVCNVQYTFLCPYKFCNVCLFWFIFPAWFCFNEYCYFFELLLCFIVIALMKHSKGHVKILASLLYQLLITLQFPTHPTHLLVFKTNGCLNFWKHPFISDSEKIATRNIFGNFPAKHPCWSTF